MSLFFTGIFKGRVSKFSNKYKNLTSKTTAVLLFNAHPVNNTMPSDSIQYSEKYCDAKYEYRHVILPAELAKVVPRTHLMTETEWRNLGVQQSPNWVHYMLHGPEPHVLLFRRKIPPLP